MQDTMRPFVATVVSILMLAAAVGLSWMVITSGVLSASSAGAETPMPAPSTSVPVQVEVAAPSAIVSGGFQVSQPRDPFRPLITEDSPVAGQPGVGGTGGSGNGGFDPAGTVLTLQEIRDVAGLLRATMIVNGISYDVGVGETFAGSYKVISLEQTKGVFMFGDSAFELSVGQEILK